MIITLQYYDGSCHRSTWIGHRYTCVSLSLNPLPPPSPPCPSGCHRAVALGSLLYASNSHWSPSLHMVMYRFQCYFLKSSHPLLLLLSPEVCSLCLCLLGCPVCVCAFLRPTWGQNWGLIVDPSKASVCRTYGCDSDHTTPLSGTFW